MAMNNAERERYRERIRKYAVRLRAEYGRIECAECNGFWRPGERESHAEDCLARPYPPLRKEGRVELRAEFDRRKLPWPDLPRELLADYPVGSKFVALEDFDVRFVQPPNGFRDLPDPPPVREVVSATFQVEGGGRASARWTGKVWHFHEWSFPQQGKTS